MKIGWFSPILLSSLFYCLCWILLWISVHNIDKVVVKGAYKVLQWLIDFCQFVHDCLLIFRRDICHVFMTVLFMFVHCFIVNWLNSTINAYWNYESLLTCEEAFFFFPLYTSTFTKQRNYQCISIWWISLFSNWNPLKETLVHDISFQDLKYLGIFITTLNPYTLHTRVSDLTRYAQYKTTVNCLLLSMIS